MIFRHKIKEIRQRLGLDRKHFAEELGLSRSVIYLWESGRIKNPCSTTIYKIKKLCKEKNVKIDLGTGIVNHIKQLRSYLGLTQTKFGKKICDKPAFGVIQTWEDGRAIPKLKQALSIIELAKKNGYDLKIEDLIADVGKTIRKKRG
jgi:DNA-binding XRE family transcriptional regulator